MANLAACHGEKAYIYFLFYLHSYTCLFFGVEEYKKENENVLLYEMALKYAAL